MQNLQILELFLPFPWKRKKKNRNLRKIFVKGLFENVLGEQFVYYVTQKKEEKKEEKKRRKYPKIS